MNVLVVATPRDPIPPDMLGPMVDGALAWYERYKDRFQAFGNFAGGGGFAVADVDSAETLQQMILEMPFSFVSELTIRPFIPGDSGFRMLKDAVANMGMG
jgi:hypothetical protein